MGVTNERGQSLEQTGVGSHHLTVNHQPQWRKLPRVHFYSSTLSLSKFTVSQTGLCSYCGKTDGDEPGRGKENLLRTWWKAKTFKRYLFLCKCSVKTRV